MKIEISICTGLMLNDHSHPYIESNTVLSDSDALHPKNYQNNVIKKEAFFLTGTAHEPQFLRVDNQLYDVVSHSIKQSLSA